MEYRGVTIQIACFWMYTFFQTFQAGKDNNWQADEAASQMEF